MGKADREMERLVKWLFLPAVVAFTCTRMTTIFNSKMFIWVLFLLSLISGFMGAYDLRPGNSARQILHVNYI